MNKVMDKVIIKTKNGENIGYTIIGGFQSTQGVTIRFAFPFGRRLRNSN